MHPDAQCKWTNHRTLPLCRLLTSPWRCFSCCWLSLHASSRWSACRIYLWRLSMFFCQLCCCYRYGWAGQTPSSTVWNRGPPWCPLSTCRTTAFSRSWLGSLICSRDTPRLDCQIGTRREPGCGLMAPVWNMETGFQGSPTTRVAVKIVSTQILGKKNNGMMRYVQ